MQTVKTGFRRDIEGFRAVAVLLVILFHAHLLGAKGGFTGVDLFFVLSGYLITGLLITEAEKTGTISLLAFYARRARRLLPASFAMMLVVSAAAAWALSPFEQATLSRHVLAASGYLSNVYFWHAATDYFSTDAPPSALLHMWSLAVEEQFYLVWPLILLLVWRVRRSRGVVCAVMGVLGIVSLAASIWVTHHNPPMAFYLTPFRGWEFAAGGLANQIPRRWLEQRARTVWWVGWVGFAMVLAAGWMLTDIGFPGGKAMLPAFGAVAVLIAGSLSDRAGVGRLLQMQPLPYLGQRSYALYLWHWPILILAAAFQYPLSLRNRLLCIALAYVFAEASFLLLENPIRTNPWLQRRAALCIVCSVVTALAGVGAGLAWRSWAVRTPNYVRFGSALNDMPEDPGCLVPFGDATVLPCIFGQTGPEAKTVVLIGDSHALQWVPAFQQIAQRRDWKVVLIAKAACPAVDIVTAYLWTAVEDRSCADWRRKAFAAGFALHPAAVILANASWYGPIGHPSARLGQDEWRDGAARTFRSLPAGRPPVLFFRDTPFLDYLVTLCLARADWNSHYQCPALVRSEVLSEAMYRGQREGALGVPGISFLDLSDRICGPEVCEPVQKGVLVYRDRSHITATYARSLSVDLEREFLQAAPVLRWSN